MGIAARIDSKRSGRLTGGIAALRFVEVGPGKVLTGLIKRIDSSLELINVSDVPSLQAFVEKA